MAVINTTTQGNIFEDTVCAYLIEKQYHILFRQYKNQYGEIDIIARDNETLVFLEVRGKTSSGFATPESSFNQKKRAHLKNAITGYLIENNLEIFHTLFRIDFIAIDDNGIRHYSDIEL